MTGEQLDQWLDERAVLWTESTKFNDGVLSEKRDMSPEEEKRWDDMQTEITSLGKKIERGTKVLEHEKAESEQRAAAETAAERRGERTASGSDYDPDAGPTPRADVELRAFHGWALHAGGRENLVTDAHRRAITASGNVLGSETFDFNLFSDYRQVRAMRQAELRAGMTAGGTGVGLEWVPQGFVSELEIAMLAFGGMREAARTWRTDSGNDIPWPTMTDTGNKGAILAEATTIGSSVDPTTAAVTFEAWKYSSTPILVSSEFLEDNEVNFAQIIAEMLGTRIARALNTHLTTGDGSGKPKGVVTTTSSGTSTAAAAADTAKGDAVFDLYHSVDPSYRNNPKSTFMCHDLIIAMLRKIKEVTTKAYIWQPGLQQGTPDLLIGVPIVVNQDMDSTHVSGKKIMLYGDFSKYLIRDVKTIRVRRLVERFADLDQEAFIAFSRHDGDLLDPGGKPIKHWNVTA